MSAVKIPPNLPELVKGAFSKARTGGHLTFFPSQVAVLPVGSINIQLRYSPALAHKPSAAKAQPDKDKDKDTDSSTKKRIDPFEDPDPNLLVTHLPPAHYLVLNRFAVVPGHFILATKSFKEQSHLLEADDLAATLACVDAFARAQTQAKDDGAKGKDELFAFFNSGPHSGASQPHRHVQLLPVSGMAEDVEHGKWSVLVDGDLKAAPFRTFSAQIHTGMTPGELHGVYLRLYRQACAAVATAERTVPAEGDVVDVMGPARISYNLGMTARTLALLPRTADGAEIVDPDTGKTVGRLALNGTVLAGTALVKKQDEWDVLKTHPRLLAELLRGIGLANNDGLTLTKSPL